MFKIKTNATGYDGINLRMLLYLIPFLSPHITYIINLCLRCGQFPEYWKTANVIPVPKKTNATELAHYRPISILPTFSKNIERIMADQINTFLNANTILPSTQSGFRHRHSTTTALLGVTDDLFRAFDKILCSCLVLLDYSKAFDTIDHRVLTIKLKYYGFGENALNLIKNYFINRKQRVVLSGNFSDLRTINRG